MKYASGILTLILTAATAMVLAFQNSGGVAVEPHLLNVWFMEGTNWPASDEWTNAWTVTALTATNLDLPLTQWLAAPATLEHYQGHLAMVVASAEPNLFCRALFQHQTNVEEEP